ncbi:hypothetical protein M8C21_009740, partial [Ambrosia artemisiifolia]
DIHSVGSGGGGVGGRLFSGGGGDRRLRPHHHHGHGPQALKCPRCESLNTKFCYYNNYNLSQPRHFCKNCRRYWTKGGVLRNVPVGGGCRKTKRSKPKSGGKNPSSDSGDRKSSGSQNNQNSSSESSSLTATTTAANTTATTTIATAPVTAAEVLSGQDRPCSSSTFTGLFNNHQGSSAPNINPTFDQSPVDNNNIFQEIGTFSGLITSSTPQLPIGFNITDVSPFRLHHTANNIVENSGSNQQQWMHTDQAIGDELKGTETGPLGFMDAHTIGDELKDWNNGTDQALFDLTGTVDQTYWSQTQWDDHDHDGHDQLNYLP